MNSSVAQVVLNEAQQSAVDFYEGCCNVLATAGSGKTATLTHRIVKLVCEHQVPPYNILAITFSKKAKDNMYDRLAKMMPDHVNDINIETFHSFGYKIIRKFDGTKWKLLSTDWEKIAIIEKILKDYFKIKEPNGNVVSKYLKYISTQKNRLVKPNKQSSDMEESIYFLYEKHKEKQRLIDFDDMLVKCYEILNNNQIALQYCQDRYRFVLADEMQDTNAAQYEMLRLICSKYNNLFVVDDPLQAIHEWRGANNKYVLDFAKEWAGAKVINLNTNYRSSKNIVDLANTFAACIPEAHHESYVESVSSHDVFMTPTYTRYDDTHEEANGVTTKISEYVSGEYDYKDIAILTRTNAQLQEFETILFQNKIPYVNTSGFSFIERKEIKIMLDYLRLNRDSSCDDAFLTVYNVPNRWLGRVFLERTEQVTKKRKSSLFDAADEIALIDRRYDNGVRELKSAIKSLTLKRHETVGESLRRFRKQIDLDNFISRYVCDDDDNRIDNLNTLCTMADGYKDIDEFLQLIDGMQKQNKNNTNAVQLMTIHRSKGLEFPIVFVAGVSQGLLPHDKNKNVNEEKRLMYVAITRAEKILNISSVGMYNGRNYDESEYISILFPEAENEVND